MSDTTDTIPDEPLPVRDPGAALRDNPAPEPPNITLDHHANHCFGDGPRPDTTAGPHANRAF